MFLPFTPGSLLAKEVQKVEDTFILRRPGGRVKMVERGGVQLQHILVNKNPWGNMGCGREECGVCSGAEKPGGCQVEGAQYTITCEDCKAAGTKSLYHGESASSGSRRWSSHLALLKSKDPRSPLYKHCFTIHEGQEVRWSMKVEKCFQSPMQRQIREAQEIEYSTADILMNSKSEWNSNPIPRIVMEFPVKVEEKQEEMEDLVGVPRPHTRVKGPGKQTERTSHSEVKVEVEEEEVKVPMSKKIKVTKEEPDIVTIAVANNALLVKDEEKVDGQCGQEPVTVDALADMQQVEGKKIMEKSVPTANTRAKTASKGFKGKVQSNTLKSYFTSQKRTTQSVVKDGGAREEPDLSTAASPADSFSVDPANDQKGVG